MSGLVGNPEDRFSCVVSHVVVTFRFPDHRNESLCNPHLSIKVDLSNSFHLIQRYKFYITDPLYTGIIHNGPQTYNKCIHMHYSQWPTNLPIIIHNGPQTYNKCIHMLYSQWPTNLQERIYANISIHKK